MIEKCVAAWSRDCGFINAIARRRSSAISLVESRVTAFIGLRIGERIFAINRIKIQNLRARFHIGVAFSAEYARLDNRASFIVQQKDRVRYKYAGRTVAYSSKCANGEYGTKNLKELGVVAISLFLHESIRNKHRAY